MGNPEKPKAKNEVPQKDLHQKLIEDQAFSSGVRLEGLQHYRNAQIADHLVKEYRGKVNGKACRITLDFAPTQVTAGLEWETDATSLSETIIRQGHKNPLEEALGSVMRQVYRHEADEAFKKAQAAVPKKPTPEQVAKQVLGNPVVAQAVVLALSGLTGGANVAGEAEEHPQPRLPIAEFNASEGAEMVKAQKKAMEEIRRLEAAKNMKELADLRRNWSWEHLAPTCKVKDPVIEMMKIKGMKDPHITYTADAMKIYHYTKDQRRVSFAILPGGIINYETQTLVAVVVNSNLGHAISVVDARSDSFQASSLEGALAKLDGEVRKPLATNRRFLFSPYAGGAPLDVTDSPTLAQYALPFPVAANIPIKDGSPSPLDSPQSRIFLYEPLPRPIGAPDPVIPYFTAQQWNDLARIWQEREKASAK